MTESRLSFFEQLIADGAKLFSAPIVSELVAEVLRLRKICADTLPVMETALRAGLNFDEATTNEIIAGHGTIKALRSALS